MRKKKVIKKELTAKVNVRAYIPQFIKYSKKWIALMIVLMLASSFIGLPVKGIWGCIVSLIISIVNVYVGYLAITKYIEHEKTQ